MPGELERRREAILQAAGVESDLRIDLEILAANPEHDVRPRVVSVVATDELLNQRREVRRRAKAGKSPPIDFPPPRPRERTRLGSASRFRPPDGLRP